MNFYGRLVNDSKPNISNIGTLQDKDFAHGIVSLDNILFCQTSFWFQYVVMVSTKFTWKGYDIFKRKRKRYDSVL